MRTRIKGKILYTNGMSALKANIALLVIIGDANLIKLNRRGVWVFNTQILRSRIFYQHRMIYHRSQLRLLRARIELRVVKQIWNYSAEAVAVRVNLRDTNIGRVWSQSDDWGLWRNRDQYPLHRILIRKLPSRLPSSITAGALPTD